MADYFLLEKSFEVEFDLVTGEEINEIWNGSNYTELNFDFLQLSQLKSIDDYIFSVKNLGRASYISLVWEKVTFR